MRLVIIGAGFAGMYPALSSARLRDIRAFCPMLSRSREFGQDGTREHWQSGWNVMRRTLAEPRGLDWPAPELGILTNDVHREADRSSCALSS
jgi:hypothetical protein